MNKLSAQAFVAAASGMVNEHKMLIDKPPRLEETNWKAKEVVTPTRDMAEDERLVFLENTGVERECEDKSPENGGQQPRV